MLGGLDAEPWPENFTMKTPPRLMSMLRLDHEPWPEIFHEN